MVLAIDRRLSPAASALWSRKAFSPSGRTADGSGCTAASQSPRTCSSGNSEASHALEADVDKADVRDRVGDALGHSKSISIARPRCRSCGPSIIARFEG
jgi:hypothetical protein